MRLNKCFDIAGNNHLRTTVLKHLIIFFCALLILSCQSVDDSDNDLVARVGPYTLSKQRVDQPYIYEANGVDSAIAVKEFIEQWAFDKAFEIEAMKQLQSRQELEKLIDAYRASLLTHLFEKQLIEEHLDSLITQSELQGYYERNKTQYILSSPIMRVQYINIRLDHPDVDEIMRLWKGFDNPGVTDSLIAVCHESAITFLLEDSVWYKLDELTSVIPPDFLKKHAGFSEQIFSNDTTKHFLRILEQIPDTEIAPLSFIEKQARKVILYQRKQELIREWREKIYREGVKSNRIKIY